MIIVNNVRQSVENRWRDLVDNGKRFTGISPNVDPNTPPDWFNANKFRKSQQLGRKYYGSLGFGQFLGLMVMLYHTEAYATLTSTGQSSNVQKLFRRYLSTLVHVKHWFDFDPFDVNSQAYQSLKYVRGLHRQVASMLTTKWERMEGRDDLPISQYGMTHAQFAFTGFVALYPKQCGLHGLSDDDFDCLLYFWRVIGYCLGCDDRFNLCNGTADEVVGLCQLMFTREWYPLMSADLPVCEGGVEMAKGICLAMNQLARFISYDVIMKYWYPILSIDNKTVELQTYSEIFWYYIIKYQLNYFNKLSICQYMMSATARLSLKIAVWLKNFKYNLLAKQYKDKQYDYNQINNNKCPLNVHIDIEYKNVFEAIKK